MAIEQGADFIECDLALTKDGVLVCLHDAYLSSVTNVASIEDFADRKVTFDIYMLENTADLFSVLLIIMAKLISKTGG